MRLLNTRTFKIEEYHGRNVPNYAILSHTWGREEISFADYHDPKLTSISWNTRLKAGWQKIKNTCEQAARQKFGHVWIDTCCIDKSSSAELSEAINSMAEWYRQAGICLVYLEDVLLEDVSQEDISQEAAETVQEQFKKCRWFTRGWTLQELIFPRHIRFYDSEWQYIGDKADMKAEIMQITNVDSCVLADSKFLPGVCVAKRMSWAARRESTRLEDTAYCLMGIFDVHMPLLYGEGNKAFQRLQEEILKKTSDPSILLWNPATPDASSSSPPKYTSIFASSPDEFFCDRRVTGYNGAQGIEIAMMYAGLRIVAPVVNDGGDLYIVLACRYEDDYSGPIAIKVHEKLTRSTKAHPLSSGSDHLTVTRESNPCFEGTANNVHRIVALQRLASAKHQTLILTTSEDTMSRATFPCVAIWVRTFPQFDDAFTLTSAEPKEGWSAHKRVMRLPVVWLDQMSDTQLLSDYTWSRKDGPGSLKLSVIFSPLLSDRGQKNLPEVFGTFRMAFDGDAETERLRFVHVTSSRGDATHRELQVEQVCGGEDLVLAYKAQHIMGDLVCTVDMALKSEQKAFPEVFSGSECKKFTRFADVQIGYQLLL